MASFFWLESRKTGIKGLQAYLKEEQHNFGAQASDLPVDAGKASIADNVKLNVPTVAFTIGVSNSISLSGDNNVRKVKRELEKLWRDKTPVQIVTTVDVYKKAIISNVRVPYGGKGEEFSNIEIEATINDFVNVDESGNLVKDDARREDPVVKPIKNKGGAF